MTKPLFFEITIEANAGSTGKASEALCDELTRQGWDCIIAYGRNNYQSKHKTYPIGNRLGQFFHLLKARLLDAEGLGSRWATKQLVKQLKKVQPTVIHLRNIHGYYLHYPTLFDYLRDAGIPVLWTLHDAWSFTGHCSHFASVGCDKWKSGCGSCPQTSEYPKSWWLDRSARNFKLKQRYFTQVPTLQLVAVSNWLAETVRNSFFGVKVPIHTIVNGVNTEIFRRLDWHSVADDQQGKSESRINYSQHAIPTIADLRQKYGITAKRVVMASARPWSRKKGLYDLIQLCSLLQTSYDVNELQVVLVGVNDSQRKLQPSNAIGIARTENLSELCALYNLADVYVNASYEESFGLTTAEALACGTPVIGYNNTGTKEILEGLQGDGPNPGAILVPTGDVTEIYNSVKTILENESISIDVNYSLKDVVKSDSENIDFNNSLTVDRSNSNSKIKTSIAVNDYKLRSNIKENYDKSQQLSDYSRLINSLH